MKTVTTEACIEADEDYEWKRKAVAYILNDKSIRFDDKVSKLYDDLRAACEETERVVAASMGE